MSPVRLALQSEPYGSTGNIGENFRKLLGAPALDPLQTVIREAVQNIADASKLGTGPVIILRIRALTAAQARTMRECVLGDLPKEPHSRERILAFLDREEPVVMEICDFGTTGLGGPTRADRIPVGTASTDFIDFLRNVGSPRDTAHGGGTYGFGKVALYRASRCSAILVDSLVAGGGPDSRRVIGCHVGGSFEVPENGLRRRYTGRHWWGIREPGDGIVDPVTGEDAATLADALGFLPRNDRQSGTSIMILDFDLQDEGRDIVGQRVVEALLWNFWPRMMRDTDPGRRFTCRVEIDGVPRDIPRPEEFAPLDLFAKAMRAARSGEGNDVRSIRSQRPARHLGNLSIEKGLRTPRRHLVESDSLFPGVCHHIALMRPVELVVKYLDGTPLPDERLEWAGVFIADGEDEVERAFADSEPPAHDDWIPDNLPKGWAKTFVNVTLRELRRHAFEMGTPAQRQASETASGVPLARVAGRLGAALEGTAGVGAGMTRGRGNGGGGRPARARATRPRFVRLERDREGSVAIFSTVVRQDAKRSGVALRAQAAVALDGTAASNIDDFVGRPRVIGIRASGSDTSCGGPRIPIDGGEGQYEILVRMPRDCAVTVDVEVLPGEGS
jgi:hypothetical protein